MLQHEPQFGEEVAGRAVYAQQVWHLADDGDAYKAFDKPSHHRSRNAATQPMRSVPMSRKTAPIRIARVQVSVLKSAVPRAAMAPTVSAEIRPVAVSGPTTSRREVPSSA